MRINFLLPFLVIPFFMSVEGLAQSKKNTSSTKPNEAGQPKGDEAGKIHLKEKMDHPDDSSFVHLHKELMLYNESDTLELDEEYFDLEGEEGFSLEIDSMWLNCHDYFSVWDCNRVNPYKIDGSKFSDTVFIKLFEPEEGAFAHPPLSNTYITSHFGMRRVRWHYGIDLKLQVGDTVNVAFDGIVRMVRYDRNGYGNYVLVRHANGLETLYAHLSEQLVKVGQVLKAGDVVGLGGNTGRSTGPHLHFEVRYQGNPINPLELYDFNKNALVSDVLLISPKTFQYLKEAKKVVYHSVRRGDTLSGISRKYGVPIQTLTKLNKISTKSTLRIGQKIRVR
jgi:murein DD-endopeptidase MepM/ murein hydrolase activator NlpD